MSGYGFPNAIFVNAVSVDSDDVPVEPVEGMGVTVLLATDRHPYTVVAVERLHGRVVRAKMQADKVTIKADTMGAEAEKIEPDPTSQDIRWIRLITRGKYAGLWRTVSEFGGTPVAVGMRSYYRAPEF